MKTTFRKPYDETVDYSQTFDKEKMNVIQGGQEFNRFDMIQEANKDLNIYEVLKKYNLSDDLCTAEAYYKNLNGPKGTIADITALQEFAHAGEMLEYTKRANEMFMNLPVELRQKFDNNQEKFIKEGPKFLQELIDQANKPIKQNQDQDKGEKDNVTK